MGALPNWQRHCNKTPHSPTLICGATRNARDGGTTKRAEPKDIGARPMI